MDKLNCVQVSLALVDNSMITRLTPNTVGYIGEIKPVSAEALASTKIGHADIGMKIKLVVGVADREHDNVFGFVVDNKKNVAMKRGDLCPSNKDTTYSTNIQIKWSDKAKCLHTEYPFNNLRLLRINGNVVEEWEISVTSQGGKFFLSEQKVYTWKLFRDGDSFASFDDGLNDWPQMCEFLRTILGQTRIETLSLFTENLEIREMDPEPEKFKGNQGRVAWWNYSKGIGVIETNDGSARIHWSQVAPRQGKRFLMQGELVSYQKLAEPKTNSGRSTTFGWEALGVKNI